LQTVQGVSFGEQFNVIFTADITTLCVLLFSQTDISKFFSVSRISRDSLGGLAAIFFAAYSQLSRDFRGGGGLAKFSRLATG